MRLRSPISGRFGALASLRWVSQSFAALDYPHLTGILTGSDVQCIALVKQTRHWGEYLWLWALMTVLPFQTSRDHSPQLDFFSRAPIRSRTIIDPFP